MPREIPNETRFPSRNPTNQQGFVKRDCRVNSVVSETRAFRENYLSFQVDETLFPAIETLFPPIKFFLSFHLRAFAIHIMCRLPYIYVSFAIQFCFICHTNILILYHLPYNCKSTCHFLNNLLLLTLKCYNICQFRPHNQITTFTIQQVSLLKV